jgi:hypothetical protein
MINIKKWHEWLLWQPWRHNEPHYHTSNFVSELHTLSTTKYTKMKKIHRVINFQYPRNHFLKLNFPLHFRKLLSSLIVTHIVNTNDVPGCTFVTVIQLRGTTGVTPIWIQNTSYTISLWYMRCPGCKRLNPVRGTKHDENKLLSSNSIHAWSMQSYT